MSTMEHRERALIAQQIRQGSATLWADQSRQAYGGWELRNRGINQVCLSYLLGLSVGDPKMTGREFRIAACAVINASGQIPADDLIDLRQQLIEMNEGPPHRKRPFDQLKALLETAATNLEKELAS